MAKQGISTGSSPNDGTGDTLLAGAEKINDNFDEIYTLAGDGTNLAPGIVTAIAAGNNISISTAFGQVTVTALETTGISSYWNLNSTGINTVGRNVGIGTTTAVAGLTVLGGGRVSGFLTVTDGLVVNAGSKITGETSIVGGLYATGISTFTSNSLSAVQFNVSGVSTFASSKTATGFTTNTTNTNLNVTGVGTIATLGVTNLSATTVTATNYVRSSNAIVTGVTTVSTGFGTNVTNTNLTVTGISTFASSKTATGFTTNTTNTNLNVTGVSTFAGASTHNEDVTFTGATAGRNIVWDKSDNQLEVADNAQISFGDSNDLVLKHVAGSNSRITNSSGWLMINGAQISINNAAGTEYQATFEADGATSLYFNANKKLNTRTDGVVVTGLLTATSLNSSGVCTAGEYGGPTGGRWQVGASGTAHYTFTGPGFGGTVTSDPTLYLARGQTYYFNNTSTAQLRIQSGANGSVSSQWNVGVTNNDADQNVQLEFEVPYSAPNTLYYQATNFNTMGGSIVIYPSI